MKKNGIQDDSFKNYDTEEAEMNMSVSHICVKDGEKFAYVSFDDGTRKAEGKIPECKISTNEGFTEEEVSQLELYMKSVLPQLKQMAAGVRMMDAFLNK